ncbi:hypothetical protein [Roseibium sp.]|uniref:hypothetical protein n=1 Tax=Roseibium sp. TaxID=1936156 RepID=UPI003A9777C0
MFALRLALLGGLSAAAFSSPALAENFWTFKDWNVSIEEAPSEEDNYLNCRIFTGGDGMPTLSVNFFTGDAGPPLSFPDVAIEERAIRGYPTLMQDGGPVNFVFDDGDGVSGMAEAGFDEDGFAYAIGRVNYDQNLFALQGMRRAGELYISTSGGQLLTASLNGFSAAYLKMADVCGFSTEGVIE